MRNYRLLLLIIVTLFVSCVTNSVQAQTGHILDAVGPVNQSMGGAGTAMPLEAMGALHWNPASITGLKRSEIDFSFQIFASQTKLSSSVQPGAFGGGAPAGLLSGQSTSDTGISPIPSFAFVFRYPPSRWTYGISGFGIGGFGADYPSSTSNPILTPQPPNGFGFGAVYSNFQLLQITPTIAYELTDRLSFGVGLNADWATLAVAPFSAAIPDDANGNGFRTYPDGSRGDTVWGIGVQLGLYYENEETGLHLGASLKSPQWLQTFKINSEDELGANRTIEFDLDYPLVASLGVGYSGIKRWKFATDVRFINYKETSGFETAGFDANGAVTGFGWQNIFVFATGAQYQVTPRFSVRAGYTFNENPINDNDTFFNIHAPGIIQHHFNTGFSYDTDDGWRLSVALKHGLRNSISGSWYGATGAIPGTNVKSELSTSSLTVGVSKQF